MISYKYILITAFKICSGIQTQEGTDSIWKGKYSAWPAPDIGRHRVSFLLKCRSSLARKVAKSCEQGRKGVKRDENEYKKVMKNSEKCICIDTLSPSPNQQ